MHRRTPVTTCLVLLLALVGAHRRATGAVSRGRPDERGDVPGWVLITVMTAGLVAGLWAIAGPALEGMLRQALDSVR